MEDPSEATSLITEGSLRDKVERVQREKEEFEKERKRLTREIDSKNKELAKLMAAMISMHETSIRNTKRIKELEADLKKTKQREEALEAKIQLKEKEIESLKNQLSLVNEKIKKVCQFFNTGCDFCIILYFDMQKKAQIPSAIPSFEIENPG